MRVGDFQQLGTQAFHLVSKRNTNRKLWLPLKQINRAGWFQLQQFQSPLVATPLPLEQRPSYVPMERLPQRQSCLRISDVGECGGRNRGLLGQRQMRIALAFLRVCFKRKVTGRRNASNGARVTLCRGLERDKIDCAAEPEFSSLTSSAWNQFVRLL